MDMTTELFKLREYVKTILRLSHMNNESPYIIAYLDAAHESVEKAYFHAYNENT